MQVDRETDGGASQFMINCAHPAHFAGVLAAGGDWRGRIGGLRANASMLSHAELDAAEELDDGDPADLAARYVAVRELLPNLTPHRRLLRDRHPPCHRHLRGVARRSAGSIN